MNRPIALGYAKGRRPRWRRRVLVFTAVLSLAFLGIAPRLRFFQGQPDPQDASHFTIDFDEEASAGDGMIGRRKSFRHGVIDGRLDSNGTVRLARTP